MTTRCKSTGIWILPTVAVLLLAASICQADDTPLSGVPGQNWPQFRGPHGNGHGFVTELPLTWSESANVKWKTAIHDRGWSSPVIWGKQIWVTTGSRDGKRLFALCLERDTGKIVHDIKVFDVDKPEHIAAVNSYASPTPVIEAGRVYVHYGTYGTACLDTQSGRTLWTRRDLNCDHHEGPGSSPILFAGLLIVHVDGRDVQYVIALDKTTGHTAWKTPRSVDYSPFRPNLRKSFCTPIVIQAAGRAELISPGAKAVMGYDPRTGKELWQITYNGWSVTPRPVFGQGLVFLVTDYERPELWAIRPGGQGDVTASHVVWKITRGMPKRPSPLLSGEHLFLVSDLGVAVCVEARSGKIVWQHRLGGAHSASPVFADRRLYFCNEEGTTRVVEPASDSCRILAVNKLEDPILASPAVAGSALFLRTQTHLYCIQQ
jgi:outer membrane protein assembly factor BamB